MYRVDVDRSLIFIKGSVPGKEGELIEIQDARYSYKKNFLLQNFPTFVPKPGVSSAHIVQMEPPIQDPSEVWLHDNVLPPDNEEEEAVVSVSAIEDEAD